METRSNASAAAQEAVQRTLANGSKLFIYPTDKFKTITVKLVLRRPLARDATRTALLPFVLRRGTERFPTRQAVARELERLYGARLGVDVMKIGEVHGIEVTLHLVNDRFLPDGSDSHQLRSAFEMLGQLALHPLREGNAFQSSYVDQERRTLRRRIEGLINNKRQYAAVRLFEEMFEGEPFAIYRYGRVEDLDRIDPAGLYEHYLQVLKESPCDIFVMGAVDPDEVERAASGELDFQRGNAPDVPPLQSAGGKADARSTPGPVDPVGRGGASSGDEAGEGAGTPPDPTVTVEEQDISQGVIALGFQTGGLRYPDDAYPALLMYNGILGGFPHSKLFVNVRERASLAYFASSRLESTRGAIMAMAGIDAANYDRAVEIMRRQVDAVRAGEITDEEMEATRKGLISGYRTAEDRPRRVIDRRLVGLVNGRIRSTESLIERLRSVTPRDVVEVAQKIALDTIYFLRDRKDGGRSGPDSKEGS